MPLEPGARLWDLPSFPLDGLEIDMTFLTDMGRSEAGKEQRRALRDYPRKTVLQNYRVSDDCYRDALAQLRAYQPQPWAWPDRTRAVQTANDLLTGSNNVDVAALPDWAVAGESVAMKKPGRMDLFTVFSAIGQTVTFQETSPADYPAGSEMLPCEPARLAAVEGGRRSRPDNLLLPVSLQIAPGFDQEIPPPAAPATFNGREFFARPPHNSEVIDARFLALLEQFDPGQGRIGYTTPEAFNSEALALFYRGCPGTGVAELQDMFQRAKGRRGEIQMPTFGKDLIPVATALAGSNSIVVAGDIIPAYGTSTVYTAIAVQRSDGAWEPQRVSTYVPSGPDTEIFIQGTWTLDVDPADIRRLCWCPAWRFAADSLKVVWQNTRNGGQSDVTLNLQTVEDL